MTLDGGRPATPPDVKPEPTSFTLRASVVQSSAGPAVMVEILMVTGKVVLFGRPEEIETTFRMVLAIAQQAKSSIIVPRLEGPHGPELS